MPNYYYYLKKKKNWLHHGGGSDFGSFLPISCKGIEQCHLFLLYQSMVFSVTNYGLGLTTMVKTNLLKLNAVQNEEMRTMLSLNKQGTHMTIAKSVYLPQKYASLMRFCCSSLLSSSLLWILAATPQEKKKV